MWTPYGEVSEDDIQALEMKLSWYLKYGNLPTIQKRETQCARRDYGAQYERFCGHLFEEKGFSVRYVGLRKGVDDGGIDLLARAPRKIRLIQCKRWRQEVDEDVISRLQGSVERYRWNWAQKRGVATQISIRGVLMTSGGVTEKALALARHLQIYVMSQQRYHSYPAIKAQRIIATAGRFIT